MRIDQGMAEQNTRLAAYQLGSIHLGLHRVLAEATGLKPALALIWLTVSVASIQRFMRQPEKPSFLMGHAPFPQDLAGGISRRAIARSLGLPNETVRRGVATLISEGKLEEFGRGKVRMAAGVVDIMTPEQIEVLLVNLVQVVDQFTRFGVLRRRNNAGSSIPATDRTSL